MQNYVLIPLSLSWLFLLPGCGKKGPEGPPQMPPAAVTFVPAASENVSIVREYPGRIDAVRVSEIRARVPGILLEKTFQEGADVKTGDVLFKIDPLPLEAAKASAEATLARAEATVKQTEATAVRFRELAASRSVSQQDIDNAEASLQVAQADVLAAKAALKTADLNLGYSTVTAPINGRIGRAEVTEGQLVGQGTATRLALIQQMDPIYFDFTQSTAELISLKRAMASGTLGEASPEQSAVTLILDDGSEYDKKGKILFSEVTVDETTGMVTLRAEFPNPDRLLLPGMFARANFVQGVKPNAVTVPQRAVTRMQGGKGSVLIVDEKDHAQLRMIDTAEAIGDKWVVTNGLKPGERVIMEGHLKARPDTPVKPEPFTEKKPAAAPSDADKS
ncbi:efflux RND transporter periplasmic adaptor subunit [Luteolibacter sp. SL250]|uniref:efflux RND transporter periplasmic adaptor subunit n=1 Tax=Luteolibacter sp. SL250 TaxID=2995170 RepID=UPI0022718496|nr:efflux RND transporter periplasmic adaptor subunit [Luteolibacter sp. SL250]WAC19615.1 efflux RND transporter periplasmic adaptor subunit [Luteolibacter sp. SL250]